MSIQNFTRPILRSQTTPIAVAAIIAGFGTYSFYSSSLRKSELAKPNAPPPKTFGSGPAFTSLQLQSIEKLNHDSSRFRFSFPKEDAISGLPLTCMSFNLRH
jgi:cytochrome-b5 reductase